MFSFLKYVHGYVTVSVSGTFCERFLNVCAAKNILLWDVTRISETSLHCRMTIKAFHALPEITHRTGVKVSLVSRHGLPFFFQTYRKRKLLLIGVLVFVLFTIISNLFVWEIEIRGNEAVKTSDILQMLENHGVKKGVLRHRVNQKFIKNRALIEMPSLAWLWIDKKGSKLIVEVRERIPVPEIFDPHYYCNIVAAKDGIIESMTIKNGFPTVAVGDTVLKDTVLVTGKLTYEDKPEITYTQANASVVARVWYEKTEQFSRLSVTKTETGNSVSQWTLQLFGKEIPLFHNGSSPYETARTETMQRFFLPLGKFGGIGLFTQKHTEFTVSEEIHSAESTADYGVQVLKHKIDEEASSDSEVVAISHTYKEINDATVEVTVKAEYKENIAVKIPGETSALPQEENTESQT